MMILTKQFVFLAKIDDVFFHFCNALSNVWERWGCTPVITSGAEGKHAEDSKHYKSLAWDIRIWGVRNPVEMVKQLEEELNTPENTFLVLYGDKNHLDHIHVQVNKWQGVDV